MSNRSNGRKSNKKTPQKQLTPFSDSDMDDDIDVFHKQRDIVPLDLDDDAGDSDEDNDQHVFQIQDDSDDEDEDEDESEDDTGLAAKIAKQQKSLTAKMGGAADETVDDDDEDEQNKSVAWGKSKNIYYDNTKGESSEDEEEAEVLRLQNEKTKLYSNADHGLEDDSEDEPTLESLSKGKSRSKAVVGHDAKDETETEVVIKDPSALSKEEQMDIVYNSAPELVGLLSQLTEAVEQLETKVDPVLSKLKEEKTINKSGLQYMELKKQLLLSYCQAITFHLLLKSEGHSVRDHPVLARLVEIKNLLDKLKPVDESLSIEVENYLKKLPSAITMVDSPMEITTIDSDSFINKSETPETQNEPHVEPKVVKMDIDNGGKRKRQNEQFGLQSVEMLKVRAAVEEKLKQKGVYNLKATKHDGVKKNQKPINGKLVARDDFDDDTFDIQGKQNKSNVKPSNKLSQLVTQPKKPRVISGDDDLPKRDDIGERRRKHEMRVLASAGIQSDDDLQDDEPETIDSDEVNDTNQGDANDSESDLYQQTKIKRDAKLASKAQKYSRTAPSALAAPETQLEGKRHINYEMEKNRGLTRKRNKDIKNPRKKYKLKHKKKEVARKGQVREHRKPEGPYTWEPSGINPNISRSLKHKKKEVARSGQVRKHRNLAGPYVGEESGINTNVSRSRRLNN